MKMTRALLLIIAALPLFAQRLPKTVIPSHYEITFAPDFATDSFSGAETIEVSVQEPTRQITLHAAQIRFEEAIVEASERRQVAAIQLHPQDEIAILTVPEEIPIGPARLRIRFSGVLNNELRGLYLGRANGREYAATQMEAPDARRAFPCFDEPDLKATFAISAIIDEGDKAISNGAVISDQPGPRPGKHTVRFATTPRMSTYLVALVVGDFACLEGGSEGVPMRICAHPDRVHLGKLALSMSEKFMKWFHDYFGVRYAFGKLDHIGVPDFAAGAMENSAAIIYRDIYLLKDEQTSSVESQKALANIVSHEMAHLWFGDLVTMRWWDDLWLNEGFADWIEKKPIAASYPNWNVPLDAVEGITSPMAADALRNNRPIKVSVASGQQAEELFDPITYGKAASVLNMIESFVGEEKFRKGVSAYLKEHSFRNATADDFAAALSDAVPDVPVAHILDTFVKQPGVPLIMAEPSSCVNDRTLVKVRQRRFFLDARLSNRETKELWHIPVCFRAAGSSEEICKVFSERKQTFRVDGCKAPVFLNAGGKGYYITAVSERDLRELRGRLGDLSDAEKIALARDEWFLVRSTRRPVSEYLALAESMLQRERNPGVVEQILGGLTTIDRWLAGGGRSEYRQWLREQLRPLVRELGWEPAPDDSADRRRLRAVTIEKLGLVARDPEVLAEARRRTADYFKDSASVDPSLVASILKVAAVEGDERLFERAVAELARARTPEARTRLQNMLGEFRDPRLMRRLLESGLLPEARVTEARSYITSVLNSVEGRELAWEFLKTKWPDLTRKVTPNLFTGIVRATSTFCDPRMREEVRLFFESHPVEAANRALAQALEAIDVCVQTTRVQAPKLAAWLARREQVPAGASP